MMVMIHIYCLLLFSLLGTHINNKLSNIQSHTTHLYNYFTRDDDDDDADDVKCFRVEVGIGL